MIRFLKQVKKQPLADLFAGSLKEALHNRVHRTILTETAPTAGIVQRFLKDPKICIPVKLEPLDQPHYGADLFYFTASSHAHYMFELILLCPQENVESISDALEALDALSISVEDADALTPAEQALFGEPGTEPELQAWNRSTVTALFSSQEEAEKVAKLVAVQDFFEGSSLQEIRNVPQEDWVSLTQAQFQPVEITPEFWIVPSWHELPEQAKVSIELDPGMAFGTGTHPTTRMCLRWIAEHAAAQGGTLEPNVLDYGCGSGILAIAAAKYGATNIDAVDIDEAAVDATLRNAEVNRVQLNSGLPELAQSRYNIVLANILANPLQVLAPLLCGHIEAGGHLVLAGILKEQADVLKTAYAPWVSLEVQNEQDGWILMTAQKA